MTAPVGSVRWQIKLVGTMALAAAVAVCPVWWAVAGWWNLESNRRKPT